MIAQEPQVLLLAGALAAVWRQNSDGRLGQQCYATSQKHPRATCGKLWAVKVWFVLLIRSEAKLGALLQRSIGSIMQWLCIFPCCPVHSRKWFIFGPARIFSSIRGTFIFLKKLHKGLPVMSSSWGQGEWLLEGLTAGEVFYCFLNCLFIVVSMASTVCPSSMLCIDSWCSKSFEIPMIEDTTFLGLNQYLPWDLWWTSVGALFQG